MGIFDKIKHIVNTGIIKQVFRCTMYIACQSDTVGEDGWTFYENVFHS